MAPSKKAQQISFLILLGVLILAGIYTLFPFLKIVILGIILVVLFYPVHDKFLKLIPRYPGIASLLSVLVVCFVLFAPLAILITLITSQVALLLDFQIPETSPGVVPNFLMGWQSEILSTMQKIEKFFNIEINLSQIFKEGAVRFGNLIAKYSPDVLSGTADFFLSFFILLIILFYFFRDGKALYSTLIRLSPVEDKYERRLGVEIKKTIDGVFLGSFLTGLIQAIFATIGFYFAGIEGFLVWGAIAFFMSFIPLLGTGAVLIPWVFYLLFTGDWPHALFLAIYGALVIGSVDNLVRPLLIRTSTHSLALFLSIFGGLAVFGPMGLLLGPIIMALLTATLRIYESDFTRSP